MGLPLPPTVPCLADQGVPFQVSARECSAAGKTSATRAAVDGGVRVVYSVHGSRLRSCDQLSRLLGDFSYPLRAPNHRAHFHRLAMGSLWIHCYRARVSANGRPRPCPGLGEFVCVPWRWPSFERAFIPRKQ